MSTSATYFNEQPWDYVISQLKTKKLGKIAAICIQSSCVEGKLADTYEMWKKRLVAILGEPESWDVIQAEHVITAIGQFAKGRIVRMFFDETGEEITDFEIVTTTSLIVWRPNMHAFAVVKTKKQSYSDHTHPQPVEL